MQNHSPFPFAGALASFFGKSRFLVGVVALLVTTSCRDGGETNLPTDHSRPLRDVGVNTSNEPAGMTTVTERFFTGLDELGWQDRDTDLGAGRLAFVDDQPDFTRSDSAARARYNTSTDGGNAPVLMERGFTGKGTLYLDFDWKVSSNYFGHSSGVNKIWFITAGSSASAPIVVSATGDSTGPLILQVRLQACPPNIGGNNASGAQSISIRNVVRDSVYRVEIVAIMNTYDSANGTLQVWVNGTQHVNRTNMAYKGTDGSSEVGLNAKFNTVKFNNTWGGTGGTYPAAYSPAYMWVSYAYISTKD
jgi:hypothetical protein